ncbi:MAG: SagB/ThcOx family dehydrogenase [Filifactor alocis]|nr:SagB/ThcOx family dehydrogenase [Filifactor alocis]
MTRYTDEREFMKSSFHKQAGESDYKKGMKDPGFCKEEETGRRVVLGEIYTGDKQERSFVDIVLGRRSHRLFEQETLKKNDLSYLLTLTQRIQKVHPSGRMCYSPSACSGGRHTYETYLIVQDVEDLQQGVYRYDSMSHELVLLEERSDTKERLKEATLKYSFVANAPVVFVWACLPYRGEWMYAERSHKPMLLDAGHICQALYLAAESIGLGCCAVAAYHQERMDELIGVDGEEEFSVYICPVGRPKPSSK